MKTTKVEIQAKLISGDNDTANIIVYVDGGMIAEFNGELDWEPSVFHSWAQSIVDRLQEIIPEPKNSVIRLTADVEHDDA